MVAAVVVLAVAVILAVAVGGGSVFTCSSEVERSTTE